MGQGVGAQKYLVTFFFILSLLQIKQIEKSQSHLIIWTPDLPIVILRNIYVSFYMS